MTAIHKIQKIFHVSIYFILFLVLIVKVNASDQDLDVTSVVQAYNKGIIKASKTDKTEFLKEFAQERIVQKFHLWIKSWHDNNLFMDAKIENINFKKVDILNKSATVITDENWKYRYIDIKTKKEVLPQTKIEYVVKYKLSKENDRWIIQKIDIISETKES